MPACMCVHREHACVLTHEFPQHVVGCSCLVYTQLLLWIVLVGAGHTRYGLSAVRVHVTVVHICVYKLEEIGVWCVQVC